MHSTSITRTITWCEHAPDISAASELHFMAMFSPTFWRPLECLKKPVFAIWSAHFCASFEHMSMYSRTVHYIIELVTESEQLMILLCNRILDCAAIFYLGVIEPAAFTRSFMSFHYKFTVRDFHKGSARWHLTSEVINDSQRIQKILDECWSL